MQLEKILLTGSTGFIGGALNAKLESNGFHVLNVVRSLNFHSSINSFIAEISPTTDWSLALKNIDVVIHAAGRAHVTKERSTDPLGEYRYHNVETTLNLANAAAAYGVKRFIFVSSIKVLGDETSAENKFSADSAYSPSDPYGISKMEAEIGLLKIAKITKLEVIIIRPPLVYGPGVKANFLMMMKLLRLGFPLPLGGIKRNKRSFVFIDNLVSIIITCIKHPKARNQIFLVSDDEDLSTASLLKYTALALGKSPKLITVPVALINLLAKLIGRKDIAQRLCGSLQVDIEKTKDMLNWSPPVNPRDGLQKTATHFMSVKTKERN